MSNGSPPITPAPSPPSVPGIAQPVFGSGSATVPATPIRITGTPIIPPPPIGDPVGVPVFPPSSPATAPVPVPVGPLVGPAVGPAGVPPSVAGIPQPTFGSGTGAVPPSYFPLFTTTPPRPPIVYANIFNMGKNPPPSTPGQNPPPIMPGAAPVNTVTPTITVVSPPIAVGGAIASNTGTWTANPGPPLYSRQWMSAGVAIPGATGNTYAARTSDVGKSITCVVTARNFIGSASATSNAVGPVPDPALDEEASEEVQSRSVNEKPKAAPAHHARKRRAA